MTELILSQLRNRRRALLAWGLPIGLMSAFIVAIFPSVEDALGEAVRDYPTELKEAFASGLSGAAESGRLDVLLSAPISRQRLVGAGFAATAIELASVLVVSLLLTMLGSWLSGAGLALGPALAGFAGVWPLALLFAGLGVVVTGFSLRTSIVTGSVAGVLVAMYVADLIGRLDPSFDWVRYGSVFRYYGKAIEDGIDPLAFCGVTAASVGIAVLGAWLFDRRDLAA